MITLIIDNYDSFTFNIEHILARINGCRPIVIKNDALPWSSVAELNFDNIVISPGPGRPQRPTDLGISIDAIRYAKVPLLGVCLGHQAIAYLEGGEVELAPQPFHGRLSGIQHSGSELFAGIPQLIDVVRYHSWTVSRLPASLRAIAWATDGTLMGLEHVEKPIWGVQFHPESICTEHGERLLCNFRDITRNFVIKSVSGSADRAVADRLYTREVDLWVDPERAFSSIFGGAVEAFWLDSGDSYNDSRFSYMGDASGPRSEVISYQASAEVLGIKRNGDLCSETGSIFDYLEERISRRTTCDTDLPFDFRCGYVGYFGYEARASLGVATTKFRDESPDAVWILADRIIVFDHLQRKMWLVCLDGQSAAGRAEKWLHETELQLRSLPELPDIDAPAAGIANAEWRTDLSSYRDVIAEALCEIRAGESYEMCLTNQMVLRGRMDGLAVYRTLRRRNAAPYGAYLALSGQTILCASPELFLNINANGAVLAKPMKGTSPRHQTPAQDEALRIDLQVSEKNRAENLMIVDLLRNDLSRVCQSGTVCVPELFSVESFATVHQMTSTVTGLLAPTRSRMDCVRACFPCGSMTGAPKLRSMEILERLEDAPRGVYSGSLGYFSFHGAAKLNVVIRSIVAECGEVRVNVGGGIIALSDCDDEIEEMLAKASAQVETLRECGAKIDLADMSRWTAVVQSQEKPLVSWEGTVR